MGDTDGSSNAAQSAQLIEHDDNSNKVANNSTNKAGFFSRVIDAFSP
jgi:hypothetical protein